MTASKFWAVAPQKFQSQARVGYRQIRPEWPRNPKHRLPNRQPHTIDIVDRQPPCVRNKPTMVPAGRGSLLRGVVATMLGLILVGVGVVGADRHDRRPRASLPLPLPLSLADAMYKDPAQPIDLRVKDLVGRM